VTRHLPPQFRYLGQGLLMVLKIHVATLNLLPQLIHLLFVFLALPVHLFLGHRKLVFHDNRALCHLERLRPQRHECLKITDLLLQVADLVRQIG